SCCHGARCPDQHKRQPMPHAANVEPLVDTGLHCLVLLARYHQQPCEPEQLKHEFAVTGAFTDSDSVLAPDAISRCVRALAADPEIGAVSGHARALNRDSNLLTRVQDTWYDGQFGVLKAAESVFGSVTCVSGPLAVFRREAVYNYFPAWADDGTTASRRSARRRAASAGAGAGSARRMTGDLRRRSTGSAETKTPAGPPGPVAGAANQRASEGGRGPPSIRTPRLPPCRSGCRCAGRRRRTSAARPSGRSGARRGAP
ncbi:hypothetical protein FBQ97_12535, partial [Acidobacteria bacterium ACD]|nr:hypothetical protein [Acidobacteria bacterium ACD]